MYILIYTINRIIEEEKRILFPICIFKENANLQTINIKILYSFLYRRQILNRIHFSYNNL